MVEKSSQPSLKSILENIREIGEMLITPIDRLNAVNHGPVTEKDGNAVSPTPTSTLETIIDELHNLRRQASTLQKETGLLVGN